MTKILTLFGGILMRLPLLFSSICALLLNSSILFGHVEITNLPKNANVVDLSQIKRIQEDLLDLFRGARERIPYMTAQEAMRYLSGYVYQISHSSEIAKKQINKFFNDHYFGEEKKEERKKAHLK